MKKVLLSTAAAALFILTLTGCADTAPVQTEGHPPQATAEIVLEPSTEPTRAVESEPVLSSASKELSVADGLNETGDSAASAEPEPSTEPNALAVQSADPAPQGTPEPVPQETQAPPKVVIQFNVTTQTGAEESPSPAPSAVPEPEPTPVPTLPAQSEPPAASQPAFSIDYWISYAQSCARSVGLNLDATATACWDNPITAGAHCTYLERDIQSRLNRYANDGTILDVWIWAEPRTDGSYDLYIGYA
jgi:hypothetical protein